MRKTFVLLEALRWEPPHGYFLLENHLHRLARSAAHFGFVHDGDTVRARLDAFARTLPDAPCKVRIEAAADGAVRLSHENIKPGVPVRVALAGEPVDSADPFLRHKTSRRAVYQRAQAARPDAQDVLLWNEREELTETCTANVVLDIDGRRLTPHPAAGLLPGTFRRYLLERGEIEEAVLPVSLLEQASKLYLINSVRKWCDIELIA